MRNEATRKRFDELPEEAKNEFRKYADMLIDDYINSFARSQAIEFEEWYWSENCPYYWMGGTYSHGETNEVVSTSELYSLFLSHQAKQSNPETK